MTRLILDVRESDGHPGRCHVNVSVVNATLDPPSEAEDATMERFQAAVSGVMEQMLRELAAEGYQRAAIIGSHPFEGEK